MKYIIGNWKSNKTTNEVEEWFRIFSSYIKEGKSIDVNNFVIVICPPFVYLPLAKKLIDNYKLPINLGAQDISPFEDGAYTGEVSGNMLLEFVKYVIVGHSERRSNFRENDEILFQKAHRAIKSQLQVIYCVQGKETPIPKQINIVAYEPVWAIGTGKSETEENANNVAGYIKKASLVNQVIYGGSVTSDNVEKFIMADNIDGVLPGGASLDPHHFWQIISNAKKT